MKSWILNKNYLSYWLRQLRKDRELIAPLRERGDIVFKSIDKIHEIALDSSALIPSIKEFLFPQFEPMLKKTGDEIIGLRSKAKRVIFGVRSCDISALSLLDRFYLSAIPEPYYEIRRKNTVFISIVCNLPDSTCFCGSIGTGPYLKGDFDIQLYDLQDRYLIQAGSRQGQELCSKYSFLMRKPEKSDLDDQYEIELSSKAMFQKQVNLEVARKLIKEGVIDDEFWKGVTERCFECGGCVYECPLCTCFTIIERRYMSVRGRGSSLGEPPEFGSIERLRLWDTCLFKGFTSMAGGILPNEKRFLRTKRWFYHKLIHYPDTIGGFGCVGCGRCTLTCPARIDMANVVGRME